MRVINVIIPILRWLMILLEVVIFHTRVIFFFSSGTLYIILIAFLNIILKKGLPCSTRLRWDLRCISNGTKMGLICCNNHCKLHIASLGPRSRGLQKLKWCTSFGVLFLIFLCAAKCVLIWIFRKCWSEFWLHDKGLRIHWRALCATYSVWLTQEKVLVWFCMQWKRLFLTYSWDVLVAFFGANIITSFVRNIFMYHSCIYWQSKAV